MTPFNAASDENFVKMTTSSFQWSYLLMGILITSYPFLFFTRDTIFNVAGQMSPNHPTFTEINFTHCYISATNILDMKYIPLQFNQIQMFRQNDFAIAIDFEFHSGSILIQYRRWVSKERTRASPAITWLRLMRTQHSMALYTRPIFWLHNACTSNDLG